MKALGEKLKALVESEAAGFGLFLVGQSSSPNGLFRFYVDSEQVLNLNTLAEFTKQVSRKIDEGDFGDHKFTFEISTPGADKPIADFRQLKKHIGRILDIETREGQKFDARFSALEGEVLQLEKQTKGKMKDIPAEALELPFSAIKTVTVKITFK